MPFSAQMTYGRPASWGARERKSHLCLPARPDVASPEDGDPREAKRRGTTPPPDDVPAAL